METERAVDRGGRGDAGSMLFAGGHGSLASGSARQLAADAPPHAVAPTAIGEREGTPVGPGRDAVNDVGAAHPSQHAIRPPLDPGAGLTSEIIPRDVGSPPPSCTPAPDPSPKPPTIAPPPRLSPIPCPAASPRHRNEEPGDPQSAAAEKHEIASRPEDFNDNVRARAVSPSRPVCPSPSDGSHADCSTAPQRMPPGLDIEHDYDDVQGHRILRLKPSPCQWQDFPAILAYARALGDGCFKVIIPDGLRHALPKKAAQRVPANAYKIKQIRKTGFWQVSTVPSDGEFSWSHAAPDHSDSVGLALKNLKKLFHSNKDRQMRGVRYRVDVPAWTARQRLEAGVPERSPIHPLKGDKLDQTRAIIPGIHTPYVYESGSYFGATFQIHAEDFRLASLNHLYRSRKIWVVVPATAVDTAERALGRGSGCSQFMRHRAEFFFPDKLDKLGIPYRLVDQRPGETMVILPDAYHEGFSTGYTIAEAKNYADDGWTTDSYQPCQESCRLATAIPAAFMRPLADGEDRLDLCAAYGDDGRMVPLDRLQKRPLLDGPAGCAGDGVLDSEDAGVAPTASVAERDVKRIKA